MEERNNQLVFFPGLKNWTQTLSPCVDKMGDSTAWVTRLTSGANK